METFRVRSVGDANCRFRLRVSYEGSYAETQQRDLNAIATGLEGIVELLREWAVSGHPASDITVVLPVVE